MPINTHAPRAEWDSLAAWLRTRDADDLVDDAVRGALTDWEAVQLLDSFGIADTPLNRRALGREINAAICDEAAA